MRIKTWTFRCAPHNAPPPNTQADHALARDLGISPLLVHLLRLRGVETASMDLFLAPHLRLLAPPALWPGVPRAADILAQKLCAGETLVVWGDYDVDGITAAALVLDVLHVHGITARVHLPDRRSEGYGLNIPTIDRLFDEGVRVLLTVDCGISDVDAVSHARTKGMTVIISDHHLPPSTLPPAHAICNPRMEDCPCPQLAGVGVAFFLMAAVNAALATHTGKRCDMRDVLDLVALGTLADIVSLVGQNRILVKNGLLKIAAATRPGIAALKQVCKLAPAAVLGAEKVVFTLAPRVNAAGRMGQALTALHMLRAPSMDAALPLAQELDNMNTQRRVEEERIYQEARLAALDCPDAAGLVLYGKNWHPGIIGIVASRIVEEFHRPTLVLCDDGEHIKGSGRSVSAFDLHAGLTSIAGILLAYGGHKLAAGLRLEAGRLHEARALFDATVRAAIGGDVPAPKLTLDAELDFATACDKDFLHELDLLQPFGSGNAEPVFVSPPLLVRGRRTFGPTRDHVILDVLDEVSGVSLPAKAWRMARHLPESLRGSRMRLAYTPRLDTYNGAASVEVRVRDWQIL